MLLLPYYRRLPLPSAFSVIGASSVGAGDVDEDEGGFQGAEASRGRALFRDLIRVLFCSLKRSLGYFFVP